MIGMYYRLTKPGIVYGNLFTVLAGYLFAARTSVSPVVLIAVLIGMALVIGGACVFNNVIDRDIDAKMERTQNRATVTGTISVRRALVFGMLLSICGGMILLFHTNPLTAAVGCAGFIAYVLIYSFSKRVTRTHTLIGSISGAVPILAGYTASTGRIDDAGIVLFLSMVLWQMPHFYSIALYRLNEYAAAGIPLLPSEKGAYLTKIVITVYIAAFILAELSLTVLGYTGYTYCVVVLFFGMSWLARALRGFSVPDDAVWAKELFLYSLKVLIAFCAAITFGALLP